MNGLTVTRHAYSQGPPDDRGNATFVYTPQEVQALAFVPSANTTETYEGTRQVVGFAELYLPNGTPTTPYDKWDVKGERWDTMGHHSEWDSPFTEVHGPRMVRLRRVIGASAHLVQA